MINYYNVFKEELKNIKNAKNVPTLLLHSCCAPCSSATISQLTDYFDITVLYYNPNISPRTEYEKRKNEEIRFIKEFPNVNKLDFLDCDYDPKEFFDIAKGKEACKECGERCFLCYNLRLEKTCSLAKEHNFDYFATTLTLSPLKEANKINEIGLELENKYEQKYLVSNFKKNNGYLNSIKLSKEYNLYRQDYCGCIYSKMQREAEKKEKNN